MKTNKTRVLFVYPKYDDGQREVLALFPDEKERDGSIMCYAHIGQHSSAHPSFMRRKKATAAQFEALHSELTGRGYDLDVINDWYSYADVKGEYKLIEDSGDKWGSAMSCFFALSSELWMRGAYESIEWDYSPGLCDDPREPDDYFYDVFLNTSTAALQKLGDLMHRYTEALDRTGHSY